MLFCSVVSFCIVKAGLVQPVDGMTLDIYKVPRSLPLLLRPRSNEGRVTLRSSCARLQLPNAAKVVGCLQTAIVPIGGAFAIVLWLGNAAYLYLSVSFIQMLKVRHNRHSIACAPVNASLRPHSVS